MDPVCESYEVYPPINGKCQISGPNAKGEKELVRLGEGKYATTLFQPEVAADLAAALNAGRRERLTDAK